MIRNIFLNGLIDRSRLRARNHLMDLVSYKQAASTILENNCDTSFLQPSNVDGAQNPVMFIIFYCGSITVGFSRVKTGGYFSKDANNVFY
jgi:hypothetical protein